jgi:ketosteroid isomerase-like protein
MSSPLTSSSAGSEQLRAVFQAYVDSWTNGDEAARRAVFANDIVAEDPVGSPPMHGIEAWAKFWRDTAIPGAKAKATLTKFVACGNEALAAFTMQISPPGGAPPISIEVHETLVFNADRKIAKLRAYWNDSTMKVGG